MPYVEGRFQHWWNWSARDPKSGRLRAFWTNGFGHVVTREQLYAHAKAYFPYLDLADFSCELTDKMPPNKRDTVPVEYRGNEWQRWSLRQITGERHDAGKFALSGLSEHKIQRPRSILHGTAPHQH